MARRFHPRSTLLESLSFIIRSISWKLLLLIPILIALAVPTFVYGTRLGGHVFPSVTNIFSNVLIATPTATPTPPPTFPAMLPQAGGIEYTVLEGDACDEILTFQMRMSKASETFSDVNPGTVRALSAAVGKDCRDLQPGMVLTLFPHYPLIAFGGAVLRIDATSPQQVVPTPLIHVSRQQDTGVDCSDGCLLTVQIAHDVKIRLLVNTTLSIHIGSWVWAQAMMPRKKVPGFDNYPYVDPRVSPNGATLQACDFQVDAIHDNNSLSCDQLTPNTIDADGGSWLFGVIGSNALDHWHYPIHLPAGTRVLLWLSNDNGTLQFDPGNPLYRYDETSHMYVKV